MKIIKRLRNSTAVMLVWVILSCFVLYNIGGNECIRGTTLKQRIIVTVVALLFTLIVHELIHAGVMKVFIKGEVKIKFIKMKAGRFGLATIMHGELEKWQKFIVFTLPFIILTVISIVVFIKWDIYFVYLVAVINSAGTYFDLLDTILIFEKNSE